MRFLMGRSANYFRNTGAVYSPGSTRQSLVQFLISGLFIILALALIADSAQAQTEPFAENFDQINQYISSGQFESALEAARQVVQEAEAVSNLPALAKALLLESDAQYYLGQREATLPPLERALSIYKSLEDLSGIGRILYSIAYYYERTDSIKMISYLEQGLEYAIQASDNRLRMNIANAMGNAHWNVGNYDQAITAYNASADLAREAEDTVSLATAFQNIGMIHVHLGEGREALDYFSEALAGLTTAGQTHGIAVVLGNTGNAHLMLRDYEAALDCYERSLSLHRETGHRRGQGIQLANISAIHQQMNEPEKAMALEFEAFDIAVEIGDLRSEIRTQGSLGRIQISLGNEMEAETCLRQAIEKAEPFGDPHLLLRLEKALAQLASASGDTTEAFKWARRAEINALAVSDSYTLAIIKADRALLHARAGRLKLAVSEIETAIDLHTGTHTRTHCHKWHADLATLFVQMGEKEAARRQFDFSLACISDLDALIAMDRFRVHLFSEVAEIINAYAAWLGRRGENRRGLEILDWGRARELTLRVLQDKPATDFSTAEQVALDKLSVYQRRIREEALSEDDRRDIMTGITEAEAEFDRARRPLAELSNLTSLPRLVFPPPDVLAIEYAIDQDTLLIFSTFQNKVHFRQLPDAAGLMNRIRAFSSLVANPTFSRKRDRAGALIFDALLGPELGSRLPAELILIPCGSLWSLPFSALAIDPETYLSDKTVISFTPSLHSLPGFKSSRRATTKNILALANGEFSETSQGDSPLARLDAVTCEVEQIARLSPEATVIFDSDEAQIKAMALDQFQLIHWATHTLTDVTCPDRSSIVVGASENEDGYLQVREIYRLPLKARLVVVSGCCSGKGQVVQGEGLLGMSHALLSAGAGATLLSRWDVSDDGAAAFMMEFYKAAKHHPVARSVQVAQQALRKSSRWNHSAIWAAFFVTGDGGQQIELPSIPIWRNGRILLGALAFLLIGVMVAIGLKKCVAARTRAGSGHTLCPTGRKDHPGS
jgi:CHAT domain-containing protein